MVKNYVFLNTGLTIFFNDHKYYSKRGLYDLLMENMSGEGLYPIIHLKGEDIEMAMTHGRQYGEEYYSFVNGQHTTQGGTHLSAFREAVAKTIRDFYKKDFEISDIRTSIIGAISIKVQEPVFESQTKTKLGSKDIRPDGPTVRNFIMDFVTRELDNYLHRNPDTAELLLRKIVETEKERKAMVRCAEDCTRESEAGEPAQPEVAGLPGALQFQSRTEKRIFDFYYRGRFGQRIYYEIPGCEYSGCVQLTR